ncbi:hypothetical protein B0I12_001955 [Microbacterium hydrothermale]|uniref:hypothetical protein n=1 Tax=Microbacterium hydrothermale TaxID=857427 RepID=UPI002227DE60|nr:hypothetical protein [Microbacterium hydrothermale]MCW2164820.1 hypothetical protein [Microbacterium hydrothermale]
MPDPRALRIDVGPFHLAPTPDASTWTAEQEPGRAHPGLGAPGPDALGRGAPSSAAAGGTDAARITAAWTDWVAFAQRVLQADALWRDVEARGDAWDEGFSAARDADARNPYR